MNVFLKSAYFFVFCTFFLSACSLFGSQKDSVEFQQKIAKEFVEYSSESANITLEYPKEYQKQENFFGAVVAFVAPKENEDDGAEIFMIQNSKISDTSKPITPEEYEKSMILIMENKPGITIITSEKTKFAGYEGYKFVYEEEKENKVTKKTDMVRTLLLWTIKNDEVYALMYGADVDDFDVHLKTIMKMVESFTIL